MLKINDRDLDAHSLAVLVGLQSVVNQELVYTAKVDAAKKAWDNKLSTKSKQEAFQAVRKTLALMCVGSIRCAYCEDSLADEIEHIKPKSFFPERTFDWQNYLFACGPCNGPKGNRYGVTTAIGIEETVRKRNAVILPPPIGQSALIDPRQEDPLNFLELDLGGVTDTGEEIAGTFEFLPSENATEIEQARAEFSIDVLGLNREVMRVARENAFGGFRARLREYVAEKKRGANQDRLDQLRDDLLSTPHLTVYAEMRRQKQYLPAIADLFELAPEAEAWSLTKLLRSDVNGH